MRTQPFHGGEFPPDGRDRHLWAIVLAAGEGMRLSAVTAALHGRAVPKQFAALHGTRTFLQRTMDRIAPLVPPRRTVVVVAEDQMRLATEQLAGYPDTQIIAQPGNRGTGAGVLLPLAHVLTQDPDAYVAVFPSDHDVQRESRFVDAVKNALVALTHAPAGVVLVGAAAESAATDLGWISCRGGGGADDDGMPRSVQRFVEKPDSARALALLKSGALWNTLILITRGTALWALFAQKLPRVERGLRRYREQLAQQGRAGAGTNRRRLLAVYQTLPNSDLSRDVLQSASGLVAVAMVDAGWSDCGTPERLEAVLRRAVAESAARSRSSEDGGHRVALRVLREVARSKAEPTSGMTAVGASRRAQTA
jgi:mannose-1-phosphate guanylyltransferase